MGDAFQKGIPNVTEREMLLNRGKRRGTMPRLPKSSFIVNFQLPPNSAFLTNDEIWGERGFMKSNLDPFPSYYRGGSRIRIYGRTECELPTRVVWKKWSSRLPRSLISWWKSGHSRSIDQSCLRSLHSIVWSHFLWEWEKVRCTSSLLEKRHQKGFSGVSNK